jgi:enoyl-CoA hydratase/carnithine racemase
MSEELIYEVAEPVAIMRLNRPEKLNALTVSMRSALRKAVADAEADPNVVGMVITGEGRGFCAGLDTQELAATTAAGSSSRPKADGPDLPGLFTYLLDIGKPVIAAVNGVAAGGGLVLATMSDMRFASRNAWFVTSFAQRGLVAEHGTSWMLPRLLGPSRALDLLWSSRRVDAEEALRIGLVDYVAEPGSEAEHAVEYLRQLARGSSPTSLRSMKRMVYSHYALGYPEALRDADRLTYEALDHPDAVEGVQSFLEKRPPQFARVGG